MRAAAVAFVWGALLSACGPIHEADAGDAPSDAGSDEGNGPFAVRVVSFSPGPGGGFGEDELPDIVLGPPEGGGETQGSVDVLSLGHAGIIVLELGMDAVDGEGPDLLVFENAFSAGALTFTEPGEVAVSDDGDTFIAFDCAAPDSLEGCAGRAPVHASSDNDLDPTDPDTAGGDAFDLADIGVERARFVRITDRSAGEGAEPTHGFDLDAVAVVAR